MYLLTQGQVYQEYYNGLSWAGASTANCIKNNLDINNSPSDIWIQSTINFSNYIIGAILIPVTGNITVKVLCDDEWTVYIDDIQKFTINYFNRIYNSFTINLIGNKYFTLFIKHQQGTGDFDFKATWSYASVNEVSIPMSNVFLPTLVSNSPYTINFASEVWGDQRRTGTETCDDGNIASGDGCSSNWTVETGYICTGGSSTSKDTWTEICGDGIRFNSISTYWDDGNTKNGDGWSSTWKIESGYTWSGGSSSSSKDICSIIFFVSAQEAAAAKSTQAAIGAGASVSIGASLLSMSSPLGVFSMLNQFQLLYILLASGVYVSDGIFNLITGMSFALFNFSFIDLSKINILKNIYSYLSIQQTNNSLNKIGLIHGL